MHLTIHKAKLADRYPSRENLPLQEEISIHDEKQGVETVVIATG